MSSENAFARPVLYGIVRHDCNPSVSETHEAMTESVWRLKRVAEDGEQTTVHWLPCTVEHTGAAPVSKYFYPHTTEALVDGKPVLEAAFRGRLLRGVSLPLPDGCSGTVLAREPRGGAWQATSSFSVLTAWNHDTTPGSADAGPRLIQWLQVATALATPVSPEEVDARRTKAAGAQ